MEVSGLLLTFCRSARPDRAPRKQRNLPVRVRCGELSVRRASEDPVLRGDSQGCAVEKTSRGKPRKLAARTTKEPIEPRNLLIESADPVVRWGRPQPSAENNREEAGGLSGVVGTGCEGSCSGKRGRSRLLQVMAATSRYKDNRSPSRAGEKSEGRGATPLATGVRSCPATSFTCLFDIFEPAAHVTADLGG